MFYIYKWQKGREHFYAYFSLSSWREGERELSFFPIGPLVPSDVIPFLFFSLSFSQISFSFCLSLSTVGGRKHYLWLSGSIHTDIVFMKWEFSSQRRRGNRYSNGWMLFSWVLCLVVLSLSLSLSLCVALFFYLLYL